MHGQEAQGWRRQDSDKKTIDALEDLPDLLLSTPELSLYTSCSLLWSVVENVSQIKNARIQNCQLLLTGGYGKRKCRRPKCASANSKCPVVTAFTKSAPNRHCAPRIAHLVQRDRRLNISSFTTYDPQICCPHCGRCSLSTPSQPDHDHALAAVEQPLANNFLES